MNTRQNGAGAAVDGWTEKSSPDNVPNASVELLASYRHLSAVEWIFELVAIGLIDLTENSFGRRMRR